MASRTARESRQVRRARGITPSAESLETRQLLTAATDMTELARLFPTHPGPTTLFLAFDGYNYGGEIVASYESKNGTRDQDIQEILYRTSEVFAPFHVQVKRAPTAATAEMVANGATTVLIGDTTSVFVNAGGVTNAAHVDHPSGTLVQPNSHVFDFAYVDPTFDADRSQDWSIDAIVGTVAHEAGHTFGLAHVRTVGADPTAIGVGDPNLPDLMSYDSAGIRFLNRTLAITGANFDPATGTSPIADENRPWWSTGFLGLSSNYMITQNSYTYLQAVLGDRPADDFGGITHQGLVDATFARGNVRQIDLGPWSGSIATTGDYDGFVYEAYSLAGDFEYLVSADAVPAAGSGLDPVILAYQNGGGLVAFNDNRATGEKAARVVVNVHSPDEIDFVVGAADGRSTGSYTLKSHTLASLNKGNGLLTVFGTAADDDIRVTHDGTRYTIEVNGAKGTIDGSATPSVEVEGGGGNDSLVLDLGAGVGRTYKFSADGLNKPISWSQPSATFPGVERIELVGSDGIDNVIVDGLPTGVDEVKVRTLHGNDEVNVISLAASKTVRVEAGRGDDSVWVGFGALGEVHATGGFDPENDILRLDDRSVSAATNYDVSATSVARSNGTTVHFAGFEEVAVLAGGGADFLKVSAHPQNVLVRFDGGSDVDAIQPGDAANFWSITETNGGSVNDRLKFTSVENLNGGSNTDWFSFAAGAAVAGMVKGGAGEDLLNYSIYGAPVSVNLQASTATATGGFNSIENLTGGSSADTISGARFSTNWILNGDNSGRLEWTETGGQIPFARRLNFTAVETLVGADPGTVKGLVDTLRATEAANRWTISGTNAGSLNDRLSFSGMENLAGGSGRDDFSIAAAGKASGTIDAGGGINTLDYSTWTVGVNVNLATGTATAVSGTVVNFVDVTGGSGHDMITGDMRRNRLRGGAGQDSIRGGGGNDVLIGGAGSDTLSGEAGFDILIGGAGADMLSGGADDDLLFSGTTSFDNNNALDAILDEWSRTDLPASTSYTTRVANLRAGLFGSRGWKLDATTVQNDSVIDILLGDSGQDWFWVDLNATKTDPRSSKEMLN